MNTNHSYCIILAGGEGRRLWPESRKYRPKQFIDFFGTGRTLLQQTFDRFADWLPADHIFVSTYKDYVEMVKEQLPEVPQENILQEPVQLSTAPAAVWANYHIHLQDPDAVVVLTPADQQIIYADRFRTEIGKAMEYAATHPVFVAMGAPATVPNTAYGYIQMGDTVEQGLLHRVKSFQEKPAMDYARLFVESGEFMWNTGLFLWHVQTMGNFMKEITPDVAEIIEKAHAHLTHDEEMRLVGDIYPARLNRGIDLMLLDQSKDVLVYECDFGWSDVGCWTELYEVAHKDFDDNAVLGHGRVLLSGCSRNVVVMPEGKAAVIKGLEGFLVAERDGVLVICPNDDPKNVRRLADEAMVKLGEDVL